MAVRSIHWLLPLALVLCACGAEPTVDAGRQLYNDNGCAGCHGPTGRGDGFIRANLPSVPVDLTNPATFRRGSDESSIARTIFTGVHLLPQPDVRQDTRHVMAMPKFDHLTELERHSIALYVVSLQNQSKRSP